MKNGKYLCGGCKDNQIAENCTYWTDKKEDGSDKKETVCYYKLKYFSNLIPDDEKNDNTDESTELLNALLESTKGDITVEDKKYYTDEERPFLKLYKYYLYHYHNTDYQEYAKKVHQYLATCYTYSEDQQSILMATERLEQTVEKTWNFGDYGQEKILEKTTYKPDTLQVIEYQNAISQYANPVEFMVALMEHTGGREFVNSFIEKTAADTYIKMRLYSTGSEEETVNKEEKIRETTVELSKGAVDPVITIDKVEHHMKTSDTNGAHIFGEEGSYKWTSDIIPKYKRCTYTIDSIEPGSIKITFSLTMVPLNTPARIKVSINGSQYTVEGFSSTNKSVTKTFNINLGERYEYQNTSDVIEYTKTTNKLFHYEAAITELKTWYATKTAKNIENYNFYITFEKQNGDGTIEELALKAETVFKEEDAKKYLEEILDNKDNPTKVTFNGNEYSLIVNKDNEKYVWEGNTQTRNPDTDNEKTIVEGVFDINSLILIDPNLKWEECLNFQYLWTITQDDKNGTERNLTESEKNAIRDNTFSKKMTSVDTNVKSITYTIKQEKSLWEGDLQGIGTETADYNTFLSLLSNDTGTYDKNAMYKPEDDGGKTVIYKDVYGSPSKPALLLINGEDQIDFLLRNSVDTENPSPLTDLANAFAMMLYYYRSGNRSTTSPDDLDYFKTEAFENIKDDRLKCPLCEYTIDEAGFEEMENCPRCGSGKEQFVKVNEISRVAVPSAA